MLLRVLSRGYIAIAAFIYNQAVNEFTAQYTEKKDVLFQVLSCCGGSAGTPKMDAFHFVACFHSHIFYIP